MNCIFNCRVSLWWLLFWFTSIYRHGRVNTDSYRLVSAHKLKKILIFFIPWLTLLSLINMDRKYRLSHPWCTLWNPPHTKNIYPVLQLNKCQLILISNYILILSDLYSGIYNAFIIFSRKYIFFDTSLNLFDKLDISKFLFQFVYDIYGNDRILAILISV